MLKHLAIALMIFFSHHAFSNEHLNIGVIGFPEEDPYTKKPVKPYIRALFQKKSDKNSKWEKITKETKVKTWNVILDGNVFSQVNDGDLSKIQSSPVKINFTTFVGEITQKALAITSSGNGRDPNQWKPWATQNDEVLKIKKAFLKMIKRDSKKEQAFFLCPYKQDKKILNGLTQNCKNSFDKILINKSYIDKNKTIIAQLIIKTSKEGEFEGTQETINQWIVQEKSGKMRQIFSNDESLWDAHLIEAADFENTGESQLLFEKSAYNFHGYELFNSKFQSLAKFENFYH